MARLPHAVGEGRRVGSVSRSVGAVEHRARRSLTIPVVAAIAIALLASLTLLTLLTLMPTPAAAQSGGQSGEPSGERIAGRLQQDGDPIAGVVVSVADADGAPWR